MSWIWRSITNSIGLLDLIFEVQMKAEQLVLLVRLESSLKASQRALLSRDAARLEELTAEQVVLARSLSPIVSSAPGTPKNAVLVGEHQRPSAAAEELQAAATRVLHLGRVQGAILERVQRALRLLLHLLAGTQASYGPGSEGGHIRVQASGSCSEEA